MRRTFSENQRGQSRRAKECFIRWESEADCSYATTWMAEKACFGSMNRSIFGTQHRPLQGYLWTPTDAAVVVRVQALHDGRDFCAISCRNMQEANCVLTTFNMTRNTGDYHPSLNRPIRVLGQRPPLETPSLDELANSSYIFNNY